MYQQWRSLLFVHWPIDADKLQPLIPSPLVVDQFDGKAWIGLVPFEMKNVRPKCLPPSPWLSTFAETNIRTYVRYNGSNPGVWFFSLDAANAVAVHIARTLFRLPYFKASMNLSVRDNVVSYCGERNDRSAWYEVEAAFHGDFYNAMPGTLDHFLAERYLLFTENNGRIYTGQVHHTPYPLFGASIKYCRQTLTNAAGINVDGDPPSVLYSPGVDVRISPIQYLTNAVR